VQIIEDLRSADTLASLRVDDSHVDCLGVLANQVLELPSLHKLVVLPTNAELEGRFASQVELVQLKSLQDEPESVTDILLVQYPSIEELPPMHSAPKPAQDYKRHQHSCPTRPRKTSNDCDTNSTVAEDEC